MQRLRRRTEQHEPQLLRQHQHLLQLPELFPEVSLVEAVPGVPVLRQSRRQQLQDRLEDQAELQEMSVQEMP